MYLWLSYKDIIEGSDENTTINFDPESKQSFSISEHRPNIESGNTQVYFSQNFSTKEKLIVIKEYCIGYENISNKKDIYYKNKKLYTISQKGEEETIDTSTFLPRVNRRGLWTIMWQYTMGHWEDETWREYLYYYDIRDLNPFDKDISKITGNKWFEMYWRFYLDEVLSEEPASEEK